MIFLSSKINLKKYKFFEKILYKNFKLNFNIDILNELTIAGFEYSTLNYISLNLENFKHNVFKYNNVNNLNINYNKTTFYIRNYNLKNIYNTLNIHNYNKYFKYYKKLNFYFNILLLMPDIKIKSSWSQIYQIIGMRGNVLNTYGETYPISILNNFGKGLNIYDFFISCYGSRKCIIDSVLNTADSGYLSRKLIEASQNVIVKEFYCKSKNIIKLNFNLTSNGDKIIPFYLIDNKKISEDIINLDKKTIIKYKNSYIERNDYINLQTKNWTEPLIKNIFFWLSGNFICNHCMGNSINYFKFNFPIGNLASQALGESSTQLTLRTFHTGGVFNIKMGYDLYKFNDINIYFKNFKLRKFIYIKTNKLDTFIKYYNIKNISYIKNILNNKYMWDIILCNKNYIYKIYIKKYTFIRFLIRNIINIYTILPYFIINYFKLSMFNSIHNLKLYLMNWYNLININYNIFIIYKNFFWKWKSLKDFIIYVTPFNYYNFLNNNKLFFYNSNIKYIHTKYVSNKQFFIKNFKKNPSWSLAIKTINLKNMLFNLKLAGQKNIIFLK